MIRDKVSIRETVKVNTIEGVLEYESNPAQIIGEVLIENNLGEVLFSRKLYHNDLLLGGATYVAEKMSNHRATFNPITLDLEYNVNVSGDIQRTDETLKEENYFGIIIGDAGCDETYNQIKDVVRTSRKVPGMIPLRVVPVANDLVGAERDLYAMRTVVGQNAYYYGKRFEVSAVPKVMFDDGTEVPNNVDQTVVTKDIHVYNEYKATVGAKDVREFFLNRDGNTNNSRISSIGLVTGYPIVKNWKTEYANIRCNTTVNMNFSELKDSQSTVTVIYRLYIK